MQRTRMENELHGESSYLHCQDEVQPHLQNPHANQIVVDVVEEQGNEVADSLQEGQVDRVPMPA